MFIPPSRARIDAGEHEGVGGGGTNSATPAYAPFNDVEGSPNYSLFVDVYRFRVLFGSLIVGGILVGVMLPFASDGVRVRTFESTDMDAAEQKKMLDRYNSISGANTALLMKPVDVVLSMVISVAFLCLATKFSQLGERRAYLAMAAVAAVGYLMNTGLSSLNVQVISGTSTHGFSPLTSQSRALVTTPLNN